MKMGGGAEKLLKKYETWAKNTMPVAIAGDSENAKIFVPGFVGIKKDQTSFAVVETCSFRRCFLGEMDMVIMPFSALLEVCQVT